MSNRDTTSAIIDGILKSMVGGSTVAVALIAPNALLAFDKPISLLLNKLDKRSQDRELRRVTTYMKSQGLIKGEYEHGLIITPKGRARAKKADFDNISIVKPKVWDKKWRLVMFDIPEIYKKGRDALTSKLKLLGFKQLQRSVWIHPFPCREEIEAVTIAYHVSKYVTYIETSHIDKDRVLKQQFTKIIN